MSVDFQNELPIPALAILIDSSYVDFAQGGDIGDAWFYDSLEWVDYPADSIYRFNSSDYNDIKILVYNSSKTSTTTITDPIWQFLQFLTNVTCKYCHTVCANRRVTDSTKTIVLAHKKTTTGSVNLKCGR